MKKSMVDVAFDLMTRKKKPVVFLKLWQEVSEIMGFTPAQEEDNIAQFYGDLSLDDRFVNVLENKWDLRVRSWDSRLLRRKTTSRSSTAICLSTTVSSMC